MRNQRPPNKRTKIDTGKLEKKINTESSESLLTMRMPIFRIDCSINFRSIDFFSKLPLQKIVRSFLHWEVLVGILCRHVRQIKCKHLAFCNER